MADIFAVYSEENINSSEHRLFIRCFEQASSELDFLHIARLPLAEEVQSAAPILIGYSSDKLYLKYIQSRPSVVGILAICDIYRIADIVAYDQYVGGYIVPTDTHKNILSFVTNKPVYVLEEVDDSIYIEENYPEPSSEPPSLCWFGYPESFNKSMTFHLGVIDRAISEGSISKFTVITGTGQKLNICENFEVKSYDICRIANDVTAHDFCIFSHIPLDLNINTYIKTSNKVISCVRAGTIPICSRTPSYTLIMNELGLGSYLFDSPQSLFEILSGLSSSKDGYREIIESANWKLDQYLNKICAKNANIIKSIASAKSDVMPVILQNSFLNNLNQSHGIKAQIKGLAFAIKLRIYRALNVH